MICRRLDSTGGGLGRCFGRDCRRLAVGYCVLRLRLLSRCLCRPQILGDWWQGRCTAYSLRAQQIRRLHITRVLRAGDRLVGVLGRHIVSQPALAGLLHRRSSRTLNGALGHHPLALLLADGAPEIAQCAIAILLAEAAAPRTHTALRVHRCHPAGQFHGHEAGADFAARPPAVLLVTAAQAAGAPASRVRRAGGVEGGFVLEQAAQVADGG